MVKKIRVRIAPSPTGEPHIGNVRTFLFNWLFARNKGGKFVVRIEDTDRERFDPSSQNKILDGLRWLGLDWDEGPEVGGPYQPYVQSERKELYQKYARGLVEKGHGYYCFCSKERLEEMRRKQQKKGEPPRYDRRCRDISLSEADKKIAAGEDAVVRLKVPLEGKTKWNDLVHGEIGFENRVIDDQILLKSDGFPTYHLAVTVDDHLMEISHVLRADEWVPSTPKQILLYEAFGWEVPEFGHLPMVLGPDKAKLSKRHGATSVLAFRDEGYLPEAVLNFLALLGWAYDDKTEIFSREELIEKFSIGKINSSNPIFDLEKLRWMNGVYIRQISVDELASHLTSHTPHLRRYDEEYLKKIIPLVQERMKTLGEFEELTKFFFEEPKVDPELLVQKDRTSDETKAALRLISSQLSRPTRRRGGYLEAGAATINSGDWKVGKIEKLCRKFVKENSDWDVRDLFMTLRIALTGRKVSPPLFETMEVLGREKTLSRLARAVEALS